ncbi:hypothetical protein A6R68_23377, partial [Neotoma lepida]
MLPCLSQPLWLQLLQSSIYQIPKEISDRSVSTKTKPRSTEQHVSSHRIYFEQKLYFSAPVKKIDKMGKDKNILITGHILSKVTTTGHLVYKYVYKIGSIGSAAVGQAETAIITPAWWLTLLQSMSQLKYKVD